MTDEEHKPYHVVVEQSWSYVYGPDFRDGPWRYRWEAQEYADELNAKAHSPGKDR